MVDDDIEEILIAEFETYWDKLYADKLFEKTENKEEIRDVCERMFCLGFATGLKKSMLNMKQITKELTGVEIDIFDQGSKDDNK